jgi:hypothetical protein
MNASPEESAVPPPARCPRCQAVLPPDAPAGLCPSCLVSAHFGSAAELTEPAAPAAATPSIDDLAPHFPQLEILACLGRGGMGVVYRARQKSLGRLVALKLLAPERGSDPAFAERFTREAQALALLDHPHIVTIHDFGQAGGYYYLLMEYVDGVTLRQLVHGGRIAAREALAIVPQICDALQFAHDHGVVHRDIKPENILLDRRGQVKVADFGLAKLVGTAAEPAGAEGEIGAGVFADSADITAAGHVMGTPRYMAPEQRERPTEVDHRADIYALGVVLYQMLTGDLPGEKQLEPPSRRVRLDVRLDEIVLRALEKDPERRYASATEFKTKLETLGAEPPPMASPGAGAAAGASSPPPPASPTPGLATGPGPEDPRRAALEKLKPAATALIVTSVLDLVGLSVVLLGGLAALFLFPLFGIGAGMVGHRAFNFFGMALPVAGALAGVVAALVVGWMLLNVAANLYVISAARRMMAGRDFGRARIGAIIAIVLGALGLSAATGSGGAWVTGLWGVFQLGAGIWAFVLLRQPELRAAFAAPGAGGAGTGTPAAPPPPALAVSAPPTLAEISRRVNAPATGLMVAASLQLLLFAVGAAVVGLRLMTHRGSIGLGVPDLIALTLVAVLAGVWVFLLVCAARMRRLRGHGLAVCAAVLAIITFSGVLLGPIFGIWSLIVLLRRDVRDAFDRDGNGDGSSPGATAPSEGLVSTSPVDPAASAVRSVSAPAAGLMVASGLQIIVCLAALGFFLFCVKFTRSDATGTLELRLPINSFSYRSSTTPSSGPPLWYTLAPAVLGAGLLFSGLTFFAASRMRRLRNHGLAVCGALLAIFTLQGAGLGVVFGIWALAVLWRREVHQSFDAGLPGGRARGCLFAAGFLLLVLVLGATAGFVVYRRFATPRESRASVSFSPPAVPSSSFGATRSRSLPFADNDETGMLDLEVDQIVVRAGRASMVATSFPGAPKGVYFEHNRATNELTLVGTSVDLLPVNIYGEEIWDDFRRPDLRARVGQNLREAGIRVSTSVTDAPGQGRRYTYLFKMRSGASGLLRVTSIARIPHQVEVAWKFFSDAEPDAPGAKPFGSAPGSENVPVEAPSVAVARPLPSRSGGVLDLAPYWTKSFADLPAKEIFGLRALRGRHEFGGQTFEVGGQIVFLGVKNDRSSSGAPLPRSVTVPVGRKVASMRLLHATQWQDPVGVEVATLRFVYADGETREQALRYGVHVLDWQRLPGEEAEPLSDPASRIVWRGTATPGLDASARAVLTTVVNPRPDQELRELQIVSRYTLASYVLLGAAVSAEAEPEAPVSVPPSEGARSFSEVRLRVVDAASGKPLAGVFVESGAAGSILPPLFTDAAGVARLRYDPANSADLSAGFSRSGYSGASQHWVTVASIPAGLTLSLESAEPPPLPARASTELKLSELIALQGRQLEVLAARADFSPKFATGLVDTCGELARRGACPGFAAPPAALSPTEFAAALGADEVAVRAKQDELAACLREVGELRHGQGAEAAEGSDALRRAVELARELGRSSGLNVESEPMPATGGAREDGLPTGTKALEAGRPGARLAAALKISDTGRRDKTLAVIALEAAQTGEAKLCGDAARRIASRPTRDKTLGVATLLLRDQGRRAEAVRLARTIGETRMRDQVLQALALPPASAGAGAEGRQEPAETPSPATP